MLEDAFNLAEQHALPGAPLYVRAVVVEMEPRYCDVIRDRFARLDG